MQNECSYSRHVTDSTLLFVPPLYFHSNTRVSTFLIFEVSSMLSLATYQDEVFQTKSTSLSSFQGLTASSDLTRFTAAHIQIHVIEPVLCLPERS